MRRRWNVPLLLLAFLICGQASAQQGDAGEGTYSLLPGDTIQVSVWQEPELQRELLIRPDGWFSFPLAGDVRAIGRTVTEIQDELRARLQRYIPEVVLTVSVIGIEGNKVYVLGQVNNPGVFTVNPRVDVTQALSMAGGTTPFAAVNDIIVLRREGGEQRTFRFAFGDVERGRNLEQNIELQPGDVVIVP